MLHFKKRFSCFAPALAGYFLVFGVLLFHPLSHDMFSELFPHHEGQSLLFYEGDDKSPPENEDSFHASNYSVKVIGVCISCQFLAGFTGIPSLFVLTLSYYLPPVTNATIYETQLVISAIISSWNTRAPPVI